MTNCLFFAVALYLRRWRKARARNEQFDDYILFRLSKIKWGVFHVLYGRLSKVTGHARLISYKPNTPEKDGVEIVFNGHVERGDK